MNSFFDSKDQVVVLRINLQGQIFRLGNLQVDSFFPVCGGMYQGIVAFARLGGQFQGSHSPVKG